MNENALNIVANVILTVSFAVALAGVVAMPTRPGGFMRGGIKLLLGGAMFIYVFVGFSHLMQFATITSVLDIFENYLKVLFIPLVACAAYAIRMNEQLRTTQRQARILSAEHDMLTRIVDTTPTGVVVLDSSGRIEFANDRARDMLELEEDADTGRLLTPKWTCGDAEPGDLSGCVPDAEVRDELKTLRWPDGTVRQLSMNATPIIAADGSKVGSVVAFTLAGIAAAV